MRHADSQLPRAALVPVLLPVLVLVLVPVLVPALALAACGDDSGPASPVDAGPGDAGVAPGTTEHFADLASNSEGIAFGVDEAGARVLYVGLFQMGKIVRVAVDGSVRPFADVPAPLGIATRADGTLVVCGKTQTGDAGTGVLWEVTTAGAARVAVSMAAMPLRLPNFVAVAPDDSLVFGDSQAHVLYRVAAGATSAEPITDAIHYPNGLAFSPDGATLYVSSWDRNQVHRLSFDRTTGRYGTPELYLDAVNNVDGLLATASGDLVLVSNADGILLVGADRIPVQLAPTRPFGLPANGALAAGDYGEGWLYVSNLLGNRIARVYVGQTGAALPVR